MIAKNILGAAWLLLAVVFAAIGYEAGAWACLISANIFIVSVLTDNELKNQKQGEKRGE